MPHSPQEKKRVTTRLRHIQGQALALERAVNDGTECGALLQQLAALRGAATGLMAEVLESHLRETFAQSAERPPRPPTPTPRSTRSCASSALISNEQGPPPKRYRAPLKGTRQQSGQGNIRAHGPRRVRQKQHHRQRSGASS